MSVLRQGIAHYLGEDACAYLAGLRVGILGAGGLGSNVAMHLVRSGFRALVIADHDTVEPSNLNRQFFFTDQIGLPKVEALAANLLRLDPDLRIETHRQTLDAASAVALFAECDAVVEAVDDAALKKGLVEAFALSGKLLVTASGLGGYGATNVLTTRRVGRNVVLVGDMATPCDEATPPLSPTVGVASAKQADAVLTHFLDRFDRFSQTPDA